MESSTSVGYPKTCGLLRWKSGEKVDTRLMDLLGLFEELYAKRREFFKKIFPGDHEELFRKIRDATSKKKKRSMRRSLSIGAGFAIRGRGLDDEIDGDDQFKAERFRVKTPIVLVEDGNGGGTFQTLG
ncbi:hypothetical protein F511_06770 [Dorcoceras hygrometricum]|uniref:Uncharacterized protein n=1 Tax=Dorcoceras hygrometricum TaxID=472368 RepID=A0A2Z7D704_9LAMI|nr:hypothetical protein F511_06770 [Dorcoceras hygrometricum]